MDEAVLEKLQITEVKGLHMGFFKRRKKRKQQEVKEMQAALQSGIEGTSEEDFTDKKKLQHFVINCCEQIIEATKEIEEEKAEYRVVSDYLNDIQILEDLPEEELEAIRSAAENVQKLDRMREEYQNSEKRISDAQFVQMQQEENEIPDAIVRLQTNETYQTTVKKDMNYLEGEKNEWYYNKLEMMYQQRILKRLSFGLLGIFIVSMVLLFVLQIGYRMDTTYAWMSIILFAAVAGFCIFIKMSANETEIKKSEINMNHAIALLNKVKFKYINVTNAVDYAREKYHVKNAYELNYIWEQYLNEVKVREKFRQTNEDLEYFNAKLVQLLRRYRLYDAQVWTNQSSALVDKKEMVEVKHNLIVRRQKLRSRIEYNTQNIRDKRDEIDRLLKKANMYTPEIKEIIDSIDRLGTIS